MRGEGFVDLGVNSFHKILFAVVFSEGNLNNLSKLRNLQSCTRHICTILLEGCSDGPLSTIKRKVALNFPVWVSEVTMERWLYQQ